MPATQRGQVDRTGPKRYRLRWYDAEGKRHSKQPFTSQSAAWTYFRETVEPQLQGGPTQRADLTLSEFVPLYLERHAANVRPRTIATLTERLGHACYVYERRTKRGKQRATVKVASITRPMGEDVVSTTPIFGDVPLRDLERMADEIASWQARQPNGARYGRTSALRQTLEAAARWGYIERNPAKLAGKNRQPAPRAIRAFTFRELEAIAAELSPAYASLPAFAAATGLRPEEWQALKRSDVDRKGGVLNVRRTVSGGEVVELAKTNRSRRQVPLSPRALAALDSLPARLDSRLLFPAPSGGVLHLDNFRNREWSPAIEAAGVPRPARIYDLRSTFASNALAAGISVFELARVMGTSIEMIERHYGALLDGSGASIAARLAAFEAEHENRLGREWVAE